MPPTTLNPWLMAGGSARSGAGPHAANTASANMGARKNLDFMTQDGKNRPTCDSRNGVICPNLSAALKDVHHDGFVFAAGAGAGDFTSLHVSDPIGVNFLCFLFTPVLGAGRLHIGV